MNAIKNNLKIYKEDGNNIQSIIFIHGFPFDHKMWSGQVEYFKKRYYCVTYDIRGLGGSPVGDGQFTIENFVDDLFEIVDTLNLGKAVLCGLSMGGYIALRAIEREEKKFSAVILCDTKSEADTNSVKLNRFAGIKQINDEGVQKFVGSFVPKCFTDEFINLNRHKYEEILNRALKSNPAGLKGCLLAMAARTDTTDYLQKIEIPALVICGAEDKITPPDVMKAMSAKISTAIFLEVPKAAHLSPVENSEFVNKAIEKFLKDKLPA